MTSPQHATLVANTVTTLTFTPATQIEVLNVDGSAAIYFTVNGAAPTVAGDGCRVIPAGAGAALQLSDQQSSASGNGPTYYQPRTGSTVVQLISAGTPKVSVSAW